MKKKMLISSLLTKCHGPFQKEYTAQSVLIDIYTQFVLFSAHLFFP